jgi:hypothetical protein
LPALAKWLIGLVVIAIPVASLFYVFTREGLLSLLPLAAGAITGAGGAWLFEDNRLNLTRAIVGLVALTVVSAGIAGIFVVTFPTGVVRFGDSALPNGLYAVVGEQGDFTYLTPCSSVGSIKSVENTEIQAVSFVNHRSRRWPTPYGAVVEHRPAHFGAATDCPPIESRRSARR